MNQSSLPAMGQQQSGGMNFPPPNNINTNNSSSQDKFGEMMQNMNSMMGTMQKEVGNNSKVDIFCTDIGILYLKTTSIAVQKSN